MSRSDVQKNAAGRKWRFMKVAIIGAGLAGVSLAWHLRVSGCDVTLFDHNGIAGGASGIAPGLMHPYPGEQGLRSFLATEGMAATKELLAVAQSFSQEPLCADPGILRFINDDQREQFLAHEKKHHDVEFHRDDLVFIRSGMTVFSERYVRSLWKAAEQLGARLERKKIEDLQQLHDCDHIVIAAGSGIHHFPEAKDLKVSFLKGQILTCAIPDNCNLPTEAIIGKGYIAHAEDPKYCYVGSTYERGVTCSMPNRDVAVAQILPKIAQFYPEIHSFPVVDCRAAFRVMRTGHYYPMAGRLKDSIWVCTAMGSRGLLYHALLARLMTEALLHDDASRIPLAFDLKVLKN